VKDFGLNLNGKLFEQRFAKKRLKHYLLVLPYSRGIITYRHFRKIVVNAKACFRFCPY